MHLLSLVDQFFLILENRKQPMHVGGLFLFELPKNANDLYVHTLVQQMRESKTPPAFPLNQVLHNLTFWKTDESFDVDYHFRHIALPQPAKIRELLEYISKEHSRLLDRAHPMWECHILEGIEPETIGRPQRFGLYFKIHHSLLDGIAAMRLVQKSLSHSPNDTVQLPVWALMTRSQKTHKTLAETENYSKDSPAKMSFIKKLPSTLKKQTLTFNGIKPIYQEIKNELLYSDGTKYIRSTQAPSCILNQRISSSRCFAVNSYDMTRVQHISSHFNVSINDVLLTICAGALRQYLLPINELPDEPLIALVPSSNRTESDKQETSGNLLSFILCNLGTHLADPLERLNIVHNSMKSGKNRFKNMSQAQFISYCAVTYGWEGVNLLTNINPQKQAFNVVISNIKGTTEPLYWNGAELRALYPASIVIDGLALNITITSYVNRIEFGIIACSKSLPKVQNLLKLLENELSILERICLKKQSSKTAT